MTYLVTECDDVLARRKCDSIKQLPIHSSSPMRPSLVRLVRVIPRSQLRPEDLRTVPISQPVRSDEVRPTLIELLQKRKADAGSDYPPNIRIEPTLTKKTFSGMKKEHIVELKALLKER